MTAPKLWGLNPDAILDPDAIRKTSGADATVTLRSFAESFGQLLHAMQPETAQAFTEAWGGLREAMQPETLNSFAEAWGAVELNPIEPQGIAEADGLVIEELSGAPTGRLQRGVERRVYWTG